MGGWDVEPDRNPESGLPYSFIEMPVELHLRHWREGPRRLLAQSRYAALLASMHGSRLQRRRDQARLPPAQAQAVRDYLAEQAEFQQQLSASLPAAPGLLKRNHQLLWIWDFLSLALCLKWAPTAAHDVPTATGPAEMALTPGDGQRRLTITPWPFRSSSLSVQCEGRRLEAHYGSDEAMRRALSEAVWETLEFELRPGA